MFWVVSVFRDWKLCVCVCARVHGCAGVTGVGYKDCFVFCAYLSVKGDCIFIASS